MKNMLDVTQGYRLVEALVAFCNARDGELTVGDKFAVSIRNASGFLTDSGKPEDVMFCASGIDVHSQAELGEKNRRRRLPDRNKVYLPNDMCFVGEFDLTNVFVEVTSKGYILSHGEHSTAWVRFED